MEAKFLRLVARPENKQNGRKFSTKKETFSMNYNGYTCTAKVLIGVKAIEVVCSYETGKAKEYGKIEKKQRYINRPMETNVIESYEQITGEKIEFNDVNKKVASLMAQWLNFRRTKAQKMLEEKIKSNSIVQVYNSLTTAEKERCSYHVKRVRKNAYKSLLGNGDRYSNESLYVDITVLSNQGNDYKVAVGVELVDGKFEYCSSLLYGDYRKRKASTMTKIIEKIDEQVKRHNENIAYEIKQKNNKQTAQNLILQTLKGVNQGFEADYKDNRYTLKTEAGTIFTEGRIYDNKMVISVSTNMLTVEQAQQVIELISSFKKE